MEQLEEVNNKDNNQNDQQGNSDKVDKTYQANLNKLAAILGGKENLFPVNKIKNDQVADLVSEMFKEQREEIALSVKNELKEILNKKILLDKQVREEESKLKKIIETKKREFSEACSKVLSKVENINELEKSFCSTLKEVSPKKPDSINPE